MAGKSPRDPGQQSASSASTLPAPSTWVDRYGDYLFRYALLRLRKPELAEDLVQETLLAALRARSQFGGRSTPQVWLVGILKRKIIDHLRRRHRERPVSELDPSDGLLERLFDAKGKWRKPPIEWGDFKDDVEREEFWETLHKCLARLPERLANAFTLREMEGQTTNEVRQLLRVTSGNLFVLLHRARLRLSRCLDRHWFGNEATRG